MAVALLAPLPAGAADKASDAKAHADRARRLYDLRLYDKASEEFEAAYRDSGDAAYLYNLAQSHRLAGHNDQAIRNYELYLEKVPQAPNRPDIEKRIAELKAAAPPPPPVVTPPQTPPPTPQTPPPPVVVVAAPPVQPMPAPDQHRHDRLFVRALIGPSYSEMKTNDTSELALSGTAFGGALAVGWSLTDRWVAFAEVTGTVIPDPKATIKGGTVKADGRVNLTVLGGGVAYYLVPANVYFSGTVGGTQAQFTVDGKKYRTHWGVGANIAVGKEWWLTRDLGLGAALMIHRSQQKDAGGGPGVHATWTTTAVIIAASATYN